MPDPVLRRYPLLRGRSPVEEAVLQSTISVISWELLQQHSSCKGPCLSQLCHPRCVTLSSLLLLAHFWFGFCIIAAHGCSLHVKRGVLAGSELIC